MPTQQQLKTVLFEAAEAGRAVLLRHFGRIRAVERKGDIDLVTIADKKAEDAIVRRIRRDFPDHAFLCEESGASPRSRTAEYLWVIDPLDGTTNYAHAMPLYSISIALQHRGETIMGLVVDPSRDEWFFAKRGAGAFLKSPGVQSPRRIHVSDKTSLGESLVVTGFPHSRRRNVGHLMRIVGAALMHTQGVIRLGSAALDLCSVTSGRAEAFWEEHLHPWDVAAGILIVEEAGGRCSRFDGVPSTVYDDQMLATNGRIHDDLRRLIQDHWTPW